MLNPTAVEITTVVANVALALSLVVGLVFGIAQVQAAARERRERLTLEALRQFQTREFAELVHQITYGKMPRSREELSACSTGEKLINIDLVEKTLGSFVVTAWERYRMTFMDLREKVPDPYLGEYFQWLSEQIDETMKKNPRKAYFEAHPSKGHRQ